MDWNNSAVLRLINLYRERECLWRPTDDDFKSKRKKLTAWSEIAEALQCDPMEAKKKMDSLLSSFRRERQKPETSVWFAFKSMSFLMNRYGVKQAVKSDGLFTPNTNSESHDEMEEVNEISSDHESRDAPSIPMASEKRKSLFRSPIINKKRYNHQSFRVEEPYSMLNKRTFRDDSSIYGEHVASKHRKYSEHTKSVVEHLIGNILFNADMGTYEKSSSYTPTHIQSTSTLSPESYNSYPSPVQVIVPFDDTTDIKTESVTLD